MIYVDPACRLASNVSLKDLHDFAAEFGLRREHFRPDAAMPYYKLTEGQRKQAIERRAKAVPVKVLTRKCSKMFNGPYWPPVKEQR